MMKKSPWWLWLVLALLLGLFSQRGLLDRPGDGHAVAGAATASAPAAAADEAGDDGRAELARAVAERRSDVQLTARGTVVKVLPDDNHGSRHQRLLVRVGPPGADGDRGLVVLIAHNIDLAPRVDGIRAGDTLAFHGEFEWNEKGGVVHWTHHDPGGRHADGWLRFNGRTYQ